MTPQTIDYRNIPVQAEIIAGILRLDPDEMHCFRDLDHYLQSDQGIAALVLRAVNSPFYSRGRKISTLPTAICTLGFNVVRSLAMLAFSRSMFSKTRDLSFRLHIWQHSLLTAIAGRDICLASGSDGMQEEAFVAGLMHDMGKVLMFTHNQAHYAQVLQMVLEQGRSFHEAERHVFGFDHCQVGREAVTRWNLPQRFADYMGTELSAPEGEGMSDPVCRSLAVANALIEGAGIGGPPGQEVASRKPGLMAFGFNDDWCDQWLHEDIIPKLMDDDIYQLCANL